jgi:hypothetical protein
MSQDDVVDVVTRLWARCLLAGTGDFFVIYFGKYGISFTSRQCNILKEKEGKLV